MESAQFYSEINKRFGNIKRARGAFLYTQKNVRLTDLYREEGRAILGWKPSSCTVFKNVMERGASGSFITSERARLCKAVSILLNSERNVFIFADKKTVLKAASFCKTKDAVFYKPFFKNADGSLLDLSKEKAVILVPPFPWPGIFILAVLSDSDPDFEKQFRAENCIPQNIPAALEAAVSRSIYDMIAAQKTLQEKDFFIYDTVLAKYWTRTACYLVPKVPEQKYDEFVLHCMDLGIIISPDYSVPSIVPFGADEGIFRKLRNSPFEFQS